jgi:hypothetical protein
MRFVTPPLNPGLQSPRYRKKIGLLVSSVPMNQKITNKDLDKAGMA